MSRTYRMRLFVAGEGSNSRKAKANLQQICQGPLAGDAEFEIVDVLEDFQAALDNGVLVTPLLIVEAPIQTRIAGTLSKTEKVLAALQAD